jgi:hypothetical protein
VLYCVRFISFGKFEEKAILRFEKCADMSQPQVPQIPLKQQLAAAKILSRINAIRKHLKQVSVYM